MCANPGNLICLILSVERLFRFHRMCKSILSEISLTRIRKTSVLISNIKIFVMLTQEAINTSGLFHALKQVKRSHFSFAFKR